MITILRLLGAILLLGAVGVGPARAAQPPNIVLIMSDDMGFSDLGCYGGEISTPHLDGLAANGLRFTQFYNTARCCPTRASLLTGLYPHQAGMGHMTYDGKQDGYEGDLSRNALTIAEALKPAGYAAYMAGKWHVTRFDGPDGPKHNWPLQRGFDRFYGTIKGGGSFYDPTSLTRDNTFITPDNDADYKPARFYYTDAISDNAVTFIREHVRATPDKPLFLYVAYTAAHWPMHALPEDIATSKGKYDQGYAPIRQARFERMKKLGLLDPSWKLSPQAEDWDTVENKEWEARCMEVYAAMIHRMDQGIGRIAAELKRQGRLDHTLIFFLQDNGGCAEGMGRQSNADKIKNVTYQPFGPNDLQPQIWPPMQTRDGRPVRTGPEAMPGPEDTYIAYGKAWANVSDTPFREYKHWVHEGGISTPLIVHWPERIKAHGELRTQPGHLIDIMATCIEVAGAKYPTEFKGHAVTPLEGRSLLPAFEDRSLDREAIYWEHEGNRAVRMGQWKLVAKGPGGPWELYDMENDRTEMHDLAGAQPRRVQEMAAKWEAYAKRARVLPWLWKPAYGAPPDAAASAEGSPERRFELKQGADLPRVLAPRIARKAFTIRAEVLQMASHGVIIAQGGSSEGFSLYLQDGKPTFATRVGGRLFVVAAQHPLPPKPVEISLKLAQDGTVTLAADGRSVTSAQGGGPLRRMPLDGLQVGRDDAGAVGDYPGPCPFDGKLGRVVLELED